MYFMMYFMKIREINQNLGITSDLQASYDTKLTHIRPIGRWRVFVYTTASSNFKENNFETPSPPMVTP